jgi:cellulose synthase/poly-beta-1,6-N-acetylglucosamine synthase-like glycosyltransferase
VALIFWLSLCFVLYVYAGYPVLLAILQHVMWRPVKKQYCEPEVSIIISAYNERERIEKKLRNSLALDYPKRKLQILVSLDGPTDGSEFIVWRYASLGVELVHSKEHRGKAAALNRAVRSARGEIIVFADARQTFERSAIRELVANFADPTVGAVSGELVLTKCRISDPLPLRGRPPHEGYNSILPLVRGRAAERSAVGRGSFVPESRAQDTSGVGLYWRYEKFIRSMESGIHSIPGATGAIYAIRRDLYSDIPEDTLLDDVLIPLRLVLGGKRAVFDPEAKAYDVVACCPLAEYGRKVRTLAGNYQLLAQAPELLLPWKNPIFFQFVSHKLGRLLVPYALMGLMVTNVFILHGIYAVIFSLQVAWYFCAAAGHWMSKREVIVEPILLPEESRRAA